MFYVYFKHGFMVETLYFTWLHKRVFKLNLQIFLDSVFTIGQPVSQVSASRSETELNRTYVGFEYKMPKMFIREVQSGCRSIELMSAPFPE